MKTCPRCAESVQDAAVVCRFCGYEFSQVRTPAQTMGQVVGVILGIGVLLVVAKGCSDMTTPPAPIVTEQAKSPAVVAQCRRVLTEAEKAGLIRERPSANRINVDERAWTRLSATEKRAVMIALDCDAFDGAPTTFGNHVVAYGFRTGRRVAMHTMAGVTLE